LGRPGLDLPGGVRNALLGKLRNSQARLAAGDRAAARNLLNAFIKQVSANPGGRLTTDQVVSLVASAETTIAGI
jgi:hypothetical protein